MINTTMKKILNFAHFNFKKSDDNFMALKIVFDATKRLVYSKR